MSDEPECGTIAKVLRHIRKDGVPPKYLDAQCRETYLKYNRDKARPRMCACSRALQRLKQERPKEEWLQVRAEAKAFVNQARQESNIDKPNKYWHDKQYGRALILLRERYPERYKEILATERFIARLEERQRNG